MGTFRVAGGAGFFPRGVRNRPLWDQNGKWIATTLTIWVLDLKGDWGGLWWVGRPGSVPRLVGFLRLGGVRGLAPNSHLTGVAANQLRSLVAILD